MKIKSGSNSSVSTFTPTTERPVLFFIVGSPRSGTTWLQRILNAHPEIACSGEGHFFEQLAPRLKRALASYDRAIVARNEASVKDAAAFVPFGTGGAATLFSQAILLLMRRNARRGVRWIGEKTPDHIMYMEQLLRLFPESRFIHIRRDPRDACVSAWLNNLRIDGLQTLRRWPSLADYAIVQARVWVARMTAARQFGAAHPERYCEVTYEGLLTQFDPTVASVLQFLGAPTDEAILAACRAGGDFESAAGRTRGHEDRGSHLRKGESGNWRAHFNAELAADFARIGGKIMHQLGYEP